MLFFVWICFSKGKTFCFKKNAIEVTWLRAKLMCNVEHNSDLLNVRQLELFTEGNSSLYREVLRDLELKSKYVLFSCYSTM